MKTIEFNGVTYTCPFSERFTRHTKEELAVMVEGAKAVGIMTPIRVYFDTDTQTENCVLDGEGRLTVAVELALLTAPVIHEGQLSTEEAYGLAEVFNDHRRHNTEEIRRQRMLAIAAARGEGKSLRVIAREQKVSESQVRQDINDAAKRGIAVATPSKVKGADGKSRPSRKSSNCAGGCAVDSPSPKVAKPAVVVVEPVATPEEDTGFDPEPPKIITYAVSSDCYQEVNRLLLCVKVYRDIMSRLLACPFGDELRKITRQIEGCELEDTQEVVESGKLGGVVPFGPVRWTNPALNALGYLAGSYKSKLKQLDPKLIERTDESHMSMEDWAFYNRELRPEAIPL